MIVIYSLLALVVPIAVLVLIVIAIRRLMGRDEGGGLDGNVIRRFFQYALLLGLLYVAAGGVATLLGTVLGGSELARSGGAELPRGLTFTIIGIPLYLGVLGWSRRRLKEDPAEARSFGLAAYVSVAAVSAVVVSMVSAYDVLGWLVGVEDYDGSSLATLIVWVPVWAAHRTAEARVIPASHARIHHLAGSAIGLGVLGTGVIGLLVAAIEALFDMAGTPPMIATSDPFLQSAILLLIGGLVWYAYWLRQAAHEERSPLWVAYVLLVGVGGGLVTAIVAASTAIYDLLVWWIGSPSATTAAGHFRNIPTSVAATFVGLVVWWYHHAVLDDLGPDHRTEVRRIYEYLMAGVGLLAAAGGLTAVLAAFAEAVAGPSGVESGLSAVNTLLGAVTLLGVGGPLWWVFWRKIHRAEIAEPDAERSSPTRRVYLFVLFGLGGVAAVVALLIGVFVVFEDIFDGVFGAETLRGVRFALGTLATSGAVAAYHWSVYRSDRDHAPPQAGGPRYVLLVGAADGDIREAVANRTGGRVQAWPRKDETAPPWSIDEVMAALATAATDDEVIVLSTSSGLEAIQVDRN